MRPRFVSATLAAVTAVLLATPALAAEAEHEASTFLGLPVWIWKTLNMLAFFGLLAYLLAKPMRRFFHARHEDVGRQLHEAEDQKGEAERLHAEMERRVATLEAEISELQERLRRDGEKERSALASQGEAEAARFLAQIDGEASRRVEEARARLASEAASVAADLAWELLEREMTPADRERIFRTTLERLRHDNPGGKR